MRRKGWILAVGVLVLLVIVASFIPEDVLFPNDPKAMSEGKRLDWSKVIGTVGLAEIPRSSRAISQTPFDGRYAHYVFSAEEHAVREWLAGSQSIKTARSMSKPDRRAYLICMHSAKRECAVMLNDLQGKRVRVAITIMDIREEKVGGKTVPHSCDDVYEELKSMLEETNAWHTNFGSQ